MEKNAYNAGDPGKAFTLVTHLLDFQQAAMDFQKALFAEKNLDDFHTAAFIPLVTETYNIYLLIVHLLKMLVKQTSNMDVFDFLVEKFYAQYIDLRSFYFACSNIRYVTSVIAVPTLPPEPPKFEVPPGSKMPKKKVKTPRAEPEPEVEIEVPAPQPLSDLLSAWSTPVPQPQPAVSSNVFNGFGDNPFFNAPPIVLAPQPKPQEKPKDPFSELMSVQPVAPAPAPAPAPEPKVIVRKEIRIQKEVPPEILARLQELEARVAQLEAENARLRAENESLKGQNGSLKNQIDKVAAEKQRVLEDQIALAAQQLVAQMYKFDDPNFLGNQAALAADLLEAAEKFRQAFSDLVGSVKTNDGRQVITSRDAADKLNALLLNSKGFSQFLEDYNIKNELLSNSKATGELSSEFVSDIVKELIGSLPQSNQVSFIDGQHRKLNGYLDAIIAAVNKSLEKSQKDDSGVDLEDMAERELMKAAAMIEEAAKQLDAQNQKRMAARAAAGEGEELNVADSIMQAAMAITQATQGLVRAATEAQAERVAKGKANPGNARYHKDPMWVEGLISAARAVAEATRQLVHAANEAFQGRVDEAALIAASKAVAQATAQLVAATRAKSTDPFGKTQTKLDNAANAVTKATTLLVNAARRGQDAAEAEIISRSQNFAEGVKAEIDQQAKILRLERDLELARKQLFGMRKSKYDASRAEGGVSPRENPISPREEPARERSQSKSSLAPEQLAQLKNRLTSAVGSVPGIDYNSPPPANAPVSSDNYFATPATFQPATSLPAPPAAQAQQKPLSSNNPFFM